MFSSILSTAKINGLMTTEELTQLATETISVEGYKSNHYPEINKELSNALVAIV